jgi:hypothetical protein
MSPPIIFDKVMREIIRSVQHKPKNPAKEINEASELFLPEEKPRQLIA